MSREFAATDGPLAGVVEEAGIGVWRWDPATNRVDWDRRTEEMYGIAPGGFDGTMEAYLALIHPDDVDDALELIQSVADRGGSYSIRHRIVRPDGKVRWIEGQGRIDVGVDGAPLRGLGIVYDVTDRASLERERDELRRRETETRDALDFLIRAGDALAGSLNTARVMERLAQILTTGFAGFCIVDVRLDEPLGWLATCVRNATTRTHALDSGAGAFMPGAARRLELADAGTPPDAADALMQLDSEALRAVPVDESDVLLEPLVARGDTIGSITLGRRGLWTPEARSLLNAVARRAAVALSNAQLYRDQSAVSAIFQRAMNPGDLPEVPGLDLGVLYRPATELVRLGGDLFDVFPKPGGSWFLAVGDVCGKGVVAAGHAGLARAALRAAVHATDGPNEALAVLNRTLLADPSRPMLTIAVAALGPPDASGGRSAVVCCAGHPPPLVWRREGAVETVPTHGTMLGYAEDASFTAASISLRPGDALVLFSDGVVDTRRGKEFFGRDRLVDALRLAGDAKAAAITEAVGATIDSWTAEAPRDDLVLLIAKLADAD